jgi:hypothetical protein
MRRRREGRRKWWRRRRCNQVLPSLSPPLLKVK